MVKAKEKGTMAHFFTNVACAGGAAVSVVTVIHPVDTLKTRLQIQGEAGRQTKQYDGVRGAIRTII